MTRRELLTGIFALPFVGLMAKALANQPKAQLTLLDVARHRQGSGDLLPVIEALSKKNEFLQDAVWKEDLRYLSVPVKLGGYDQTSIWIFGGDLWDGGKF